MIRCQIKLCLRNIKAFVPLLYLVGKTVEALGTIYVWTNVKAARVFFLLFTYASIYTGQMSLFHAVVYTYAEIKINIPPLICIYIIFSVEAVI